MARIKAFAALRPKPELAAKICELPYDVMSSEEAREMAQGNDVSFLRVSKPEIDLPEGTNPYASEVYAKGKENLARLIEQGALYQETAPRLYLYRQVMGAHSQLGLVAVASCEDYLNNIIKKHEFTRPEKEDDRVRHVESLNAQTGPVFLTYRASEELDRRLQEHTARDPEVDFTAPGNVRHTAWSISDPEEIRWIEERFAEIPFLYIADGHHRSAAAGRVFESRQGAGESAWFLSVIFPHNQMQILPYNRVLKDLNGMTPPQLLEKLDGVFVIQDSGEGKPSRKHELGLYLDSRWRTLTFRPHFARASDPFEQLDVTLLQKFVLEPLFGIEDPRRSDRINFVGGIRGPQELEKLVKSGQYQCAFAMYPTGIEDLMAIADKDGVMPPKSTWFEPKLRDAMFSHLI